jgi:hypothetical protein
MKTFVNNSKEELTVLSQKGKQCIIRFTETGSIRKANIDNIRAGKVRDLYSPSVYSVGYYGEFEKVTYWKQAKQLWQNMLKRCYCEADKKGYYGKVEVDLRWHCFSNFLNDIKNLKGFECWLQGQNTGSTKYNLDKDTIQEGCKVYSKETCMFITESENKAAGARNGKPYTKNPKVATA